MSNDNSIGAIILAIVAAFLMLAVVLGFVSHHHHRHDPQPVPQPYPVPVRPWYPWYPWHPHR